MVKKVYQTHDNGGRPFKVEIDGKNVKVFVNKDDDEGSGDAFDSEDKLFFQPEEVFVGESPRNRMTEFSGGYGEDFKGNSILLHMGDNEYVHIGTEVFQFKSKKKIVKYVSPVGNSDVPYPYAVDENGAHYLMIENIVVNVPERYRNDPYDYYYSMQLITTDIGSIPPKPAPIPDFHNIKEFYIGGEPYTLTYHSNAAEDYDRIAAWENFGEGMTVVLTDGTRSELTRDGYIELMDAFGKLVELSQMKDVKILHERVW